MTRLMVHVTSKSHYTKNLYALTSDFSLDKTKTKNKSIVVRREEHNSTCSTIFSIQKHLVKNWV